MKHFASICLFTVLLALPARAQEAGFAFLQVGNDAAASAMGDARVAFSRGPFATYWNPAGLAVDTQNALAAAHRIWIADERTYALAARFRAGAKGGLGLFLTATRNEDFEVRQRPGDPDGSFDVQFLALGASYARAFGPLRAGMTAKYLSEQIFSENASGFAFDFGAQLGLLDDALHFGAALQNVGEVNELATVATPLPRILRAGIAVLPFRILTETDGKALLNLQLAGEASHLFEDDLTRLHLGAGAEVFDLVMVRAGFITNDELRSLTLGAGLAFNAFLFDYAFVPFEDGFGGPGHVLTLVYGW